MQILEIDEWAVGKKLNVISFRFFLLLILYLLEDPGVRLAREQPGSSNDHPTVLY